MMKIEDFVAEVKANAGREEDVCKKHINKKYVSFLDKIIDCNRIVKASMEYPDKNDENKRIFKQNTPARFLQFTMVMIERYTDLEVDEDNLVAQYDMLNEVGALEPLNAQLPQNEINEFSTLLAMSVEDYLANNRSLVSYMDNFVKFPVGEQV